MKTRCKPGDLAIIVRDEIGCEKNIGKVVEVSGPIRHSKTKGPQWLIRSASPRTTWYFKCSASSTEVRKRRGLRFSHEVDHPDAWMIPIINKSDSTQNEATRDAGAARPAERRAHAAAPSTAPAPAAEEV